VDLNLDSNPLKQMKDTAAKDHPHNQFYQMHLQHVFKRPEKGDKSSRSEQTKHVLAFLREISQGNAPCTRIRYELALNFIYLLFIYLL
jgi:hypothetical protein